MSDTSDKVLISCGVGGFFSILFIAVLAYDFFSYGFVISQIWNWFVPSTLGLGTIGIVQAMGLRILYRMFNNSVPRLKPKVDDETKNKHNFAVVANLLIGPWVAYLIAYLIHLAM